MKRATGPKIRARTNPPLARIRRNARVKGKLYDTDGLERYRSLKVVNENCAKDRFPGVLGDEASRAKRPRTACNQFPNRFRCANIPLSSKYERASGTEVKMRVAVSVIKGEGAFRGFQTT